MNCKEFESNVNDLARGRLMDARTREEAGAHEEACGTCAALLADERALSTGLRALADSTRSASAPTRVESALLEAFRARAAEARTEQAAPAKLMPQPAVVSKSFMRWSWAKTFATAATAAAAALLFFMLVPPGARVSPSGGLPETGSEERAAEVPVQTGNPGINPPPSVAVNAATTEEPAAPEPKEFRQRRTAPQTHARSANASYERGASSRASRGAGLAASPARNEEEVTDFIPLPQSVPGAGLDAGQVVRVELPRSALASLGLHVSAERANERVKADVVVGEDGTARAIRFVR